MYSLSADTYDTENKYYLRNIKGEPHTDLETKEQYHFKNIIVTNVSNSTISGDDKGRQDLGNIGTGNGYFITEGKAIEITWEKTARDAKTVYKDTNGQPINVNDGNTFIQIIPKGKTVEFS